MKCTVSARMCRSGACHTLIMHHHHSCLVPNLFMTPKTKPRTHEVITPPFSLEPQPLTITNLLLSVWICYSGTFCTSGIIGYATFRVFVFRLHTVVGVHPWGACIGPSFALWLINVPFHGFPSPPPPCVSIRFYLLAGELR